MQRYVPPSRRGQGGGGEAAAEQRGLDGASSHDPSQVRLVVLREEVEIDPAACPLDCERQEGSDCAYTIFYPDRLPTELLRWFAEVCDGGGGRLEFPASLSKQERARWHGLADRARLHTQSVGVGEGRYLTVGTAPLEGGCEGGGGGAPAGRLRLTSEQAALARFIYDAAMMEGGKHWERSRGEIEALVASGQPLPPDLQAIVDKRERGQRVNALLKAGQPSEALELLAEDPKLAWVKDAESGGYPLHIAAWHGYESVALFLASLPGCLEQRDGRRETALAVARRRGHTSIEELLLEAGARPEHASFGPAPPAGTSGSGAAQEEAEYCSWSAEERRSYRHGGEGGRSSGGGRGRGPPPGLRARGTGGWHGRGRGSGTGYGGRGGSGGRGRDGSSNAAEQREPERQPEEQPAQVPPQERCPW